MKEVNKNCIIDKDGNCIGYHTPSVAKGDRSALTLPPKGDNLANSSQELRDYNPELVEELAMLLYNQQTFTTLANMRPWIKAIDEDKDYYFELVRKVLDVVRSFDEKNN
jgi:hypothetical protein